MDVSADLKTTPLTEAHKALGARMVPFAGYLMPVQYALGVLGEHLWTREHAGLFDVSHMGQGRLVGPDHETTARALEALVPSDILNLAPGQQRYSLLLSGEAGILDDLMVSRPASPDLDGQIVLVVNASNKSADWDHISQRLPAGVELRPADDLALLALQGPEAVDVFSRFCPAARDLAFMRCGSFDVQGIPVEVSRSGYTGEDGFEISVAARGAEKLWNTLLGEPEVRAIGLGARDSLRLEAGLCLHGHDIDASVNPVEADLGWAIQKRRRLEGGFPGADIILRDLENGPARKRIGLRPTGKAPAREGCEIQSAGGEPIGRVTSGGFGPSADGPVAMGYVDAPHAQVGASVNLIVRGEPRPATIAPMPFVPHHYKR
ncbi:aminomethyltransferase [Agaricicola taiwanensis]|uniref:aminomethyltransferase n=1 Tax=Agaricicola taiwanensis TaxID=591372 RepID=A0A8J2VRQ7_9RHOB|nr:glycine cleavage system aminomethyltransferase GcvT [Agaricicola taiwanensis]GGE34740.1 aminomethyltransferase [Agaricicola taiwanensis]